MREVFKGWLEEFKNQAYLDLYCMGEDGSGPCPMKGDRFFIDSPSNQIDGHLYMYSYREEAVFSWNEEDYFEELKAELVPVEIQRILNEK